MRWRRVRRAGARMPSLSKFVARMLYWCDEANLGYDQGNRWDIRPGGECDCSSLVIHALREAGFATGAASYTGDMAKALAANGWKRIAPTGSPRVGDILLNEGRHVAVCTGPNQMSYASIDERGRISGGKSGDQTDRETRTVKGTSYSKGWDCYLRWSGAAPSGEGEDVYGFKLVKRGQKGDHVALCQAALNIRAGAGLAVDKDCGAKTEAAIEAFQKARGLDPDGECGAKTWPELLGA